MHIAPTGVQVYVSGLNCEPIRTQAFQYPSTAKPIITPSSTPETVTVEKWLAQWPQPYLRPKRLIQYGVNCAIAGQADDGLPPVHWIPPTNRPYPYRRAQTREGYSVTTRLDVAPPPETITLDKWTQQTQRPRWDLKRQQRLYPVSVSDQLFNSPQVPAVYVSGSAPGPIAVRAFQYPSISQPITAGGEAISLDKWLRQTETPIRIQRARQIANADVFTLETVSIDKWSRLLPDLIFTAKRLRDYSQFSIDPTLTSERITSDKWAQPAQEPRRDLARRQYIYPVSVSDYLAQVPGAEVIRLDKWGRNYPDVIFRALRLRDYSHFSIDPTLTTERATIDKWAVANQSPRGMAQRAHVVANPDLLTLIESVTADKWSKQHVDIVSRVARLRDYSQFTVDPTLRAERASVDKWAQPTQQPRFDLKRNQWIYPALAIDSQFYLIPPVEIIRLDKWNRQYPDLIFRAKRLPDYSHFSVDPTLRAESVSIDRWVHAQAEPRFVKRAIQQSNAVLYIPESLTLDKWQTSTVEPRVTKRTIQPVSAVLFVPESITLDKWASTPAEPRARTTRRIIQTGDGLLFVPESVTLDKWLSESLIVRAPRRAIQQPGELLTLFVPPIFAQSVDPLRPQRILIVASSEVLAELRFTEWRDLVQPFMPRDIKRNQYFYAVYSAGTDISLTIEGGTVIVVPKDHRVIKIKPDKRIIIIK